MLGRGMRLGVGRDEASAEWEEVWEEVGMG